MSRSSPNRARGRAPGRGNSKGTEAWKNVTCLASGTSSQMPAVLAKTEMGRQARARPKGSDAEEAGLPWEGGTEGTDGLQAKEGHEEFGRPCVSRQSKAGGQSGHPREKPALVQAGDSSSAGRGHRRGWKGKSLCGVVSGEARTCGWGIEAQGKLRG